MTALTGVPLRVGLVGAGPWAKLMHGPMLTGGPETELVGVWARRSDAAEDLAKRFGARGYSSYEELLDACDAVSFAVPPQVQPGLALAAVRAGKAVLLEKPLAVDIGSATEITEEIADAGVGSLVAFSYHFSRGVAEFLAAGRGADLIGARGTLVTAGAFGGPFATPWRQQGGTLIDLMPHLVEMVLTSLGPIEVVRAARGAKGWISAILVHENGAISDLSVSDRSRVTQRTTMQFFGTGGEFGLDVVAAMGPQFERFQQGSLDVLGSVPAFNEMRRQFVSAAREGRHALDVRRGLEVQSVIAAIEEDLRVKSVGTEVRQPVLPSPLEPDS
jgi:predicted dehydrogenase